MTRAELAEQRNTLEGQLGKVTTELKDLRRFVMSTGGKKLPSDYQKIKDLERQSASIQKKLGEIRTINHRLKTEEATLATTNDIKIGRRYWSLCRVIEKEFGTEALRSWVRLAEELVLAEIDAGLVDPIEETESATPQLPAPRR